MQSAWGWARQWCSVLSLPLSDVPLPGYTGPLGLVAFSRPSFSLSTTSSPIRASVSWERILGAVLVVLTWFYICGLLVLLGAALNAVLAGRKDRQLQQEGGHNTTQRMSDSDASPDDEPEEATDEGVSTVESEPVDHADLVEIRRQLDRFEEEIEDRTVHREKLESDLQQYVRNRLRRGHARGWGPYLVLLYGTVMTVGAFYFLSGGWAILAMLVVWLSTLGLYTLMLLVGVGLNTSSLPLRALSKLRELR